MEDIDPNVRRVAAAKQQEMEEKYLRVRLKRCEQGVIISTRWVNTWRNFIRKSVAHAVADYLATNKPGSRTRSERPTAPLSCSSICGSRKQSPLLTWKGGFIQ